MNSSLISKVEKSRRYAEEPERVRFQHFEVRFAGDNGEHTVTLNGSKFDDSSHSFQTQGTSSHIMALQKILAPMLTDEQQTSGMPQNFTPQSSSYISKVEKSRHYAEEPDRVSFKSFKATLRGSHDEHHIAMNGDDFSCDCHGYEVLGTCAHIMAMQKILAKMLTEDQQTAGQPFSFSAAE
ncbi:hypothetical protein BH23CHL2_BH23CHL2_28730 [soil metagenome]